MIKEISIVCMVTGLLILGLTMYFAWLYREDDTKEEVTSEENVQEDINAAYEPIQVDGDKPYIELLRQKIICNETSYIMEDISKKEYENNLKMFDKELRVLEFKYGVNND